MEHITSRNNFTVAKYAKLLDKKGREEQKIYLCEGEKLFCDAINFGEKIDAVFVTEEYYKKNVGLLSGFENILSVLSLPAFEKLSDTKTPQGIILAVQIADKKLDFSKNILLLDKISDSGNVGGLIRSAAAFNFLQIICIDCACPYSPKAVRASSSGIFCVNILETNMDNALNILKENNYKLAICDFFGENINEIKIDEKFALAVGNEANGISKELKNSADIVVLIPMQNNIESLNACVAGSIIMQKLNSFCIK